MTEASVADPAHQADRDLLRRWPGSRLEPSLHRIRAVTEALGRPQGAAPVVRVTGTNGRTTTAGLIDDLLRGAGLRVGRCTGPHPETERERIVLDGARSARTPSPPSTSGSAPCWSACRPATAPARSSRW